MTDAGQHAGFNLGDTMSTPMRPLLAYTVEDVSQLEYPLIASPKIDGIRLLLDRERGPVTRNLKPIGNTFVRETLQRFGEETQLWGLDGEITAADPADRTAFLKTSSAIRRADGEPEFWLSIFDCYQDPSIPFRDRLSLLHDWFSKFEHPNVRVLPHSILTSPAELSEFEKACLDAGFEGVMVRRPDSPYKFGRSTAREGYLGKLKRFEDFEAEIIGFEEQEANTNEKTTNELGLSQRSSKKEGKVGKGTLGVLLARRVDTGQEIRVAHGIGMTQTLRQRIWNDQPAYLGKLITVKSQEYGEKDAPRLPVFTGFRTDV